MRHSLFLVLVIVGLAACAGNRVVGQGDSGSSTPDGRVTDPQTSSCPYPEGICDFDAECPSGTRCDGAMHTTDIPHTFACRGICVPKGGSTWACEPSPDSPLFVALVQRGEKVFAHMRNISCAPLYRWVEECLHNKAPRIDVQQRDGSWLPSGCPFEIGSRCDEPGFCEILRPGEEREVEIRRLSECVCTGTHFRVFVRTYEDEHCTDWDDGPPQGAISNTLAPNCPQP